VFLQGVPATGEDLVQPAALEVLELREELPALGAAKLLRGQTQGADEDGLTGRAELSDSFWRSGLGLPGRQRGGREKENPESSATTLRRGSPHRFADGLDQPWIAAPEHGGAGERVCGFGLPTESSDRIENEEKP
jgi:hypothetical protein